MSLNKIKVEYVGADGSAHIHVQQVEWGGRFSRLLEIAREQGTLRLQIPTENRELYIPWDRIVTVERIHQK